MLKRQKTGSVVCPSCGRLGGVNDATCLNCGRRNPGMWGFSPLLRRLGSDFGATPTIFWGCIALYVVSLLIDLDQVRTGGPMSMLGPSGVALRSLGASGAGPVVRDGWWWTLLSAGWLHGGLIHIFFNMMWVRQLAPATSAVFGAARMLVIYLLSSAAGFLLSAFGGAYLWFLKFPMGGSPQAISVGASAAIFGLLGALVYAGRRGVASQLGRMAWGYAVILFLFGLVFPGVDNWAHLGGFLGGYGLARVFNPLHPEKTDHVVAALALLAASIAAVVYSFFSFSAFLRLLQ